MRSSLYFLILVQKGQGDGADGFVLFVPFFSWVRSWIRWLRTRSRRTSGTRRRSKSRVQGSCQVSGFSAGGGRALCWALAATVGHSPAGSLPRVGSPVSPSFCSHTYLTSLRTEDVVMPASALFCPLVWARSWGPVIGYSGGDFGSLLFCFFFPGKLLAVEPLIPGSLPRVLWEIIW